MVTRNPLLASSKERAQTRDKLIFDSSSGRMRQQSTIDEEATRQAELGGFDNEEEAEQAHFDSLTTVLGMGKLEFRRMRSQQFYDLPPNTTNPNFPRREQQLIMQEIYARIEKHAVCEQKILDLEALNKKAYFREAVWIARKLGLEKLISYTQQDYDIQLVQQFFATVVFDNDEDVTMTWMTGPIRCTSNFVEFATALGYEFKGATTPVGMRMHVEGTAYNKSRLRPLYSVASSVGSNQDLLPTFNIFLRMVRLNLAPQAGNVDAIRGGLVNLLHHAYRVLQAGPECRGQEVDVMDFIKCEMHWAIFEHKNPLYAPYVMKLILSKVPTLDRSTFIKHAKGTLHILSKHTKQASSSHAPPPQTSDEEDVPLPKRRSKNADPPTSLQGKDRVNAEFRKLSWWKRKLLCMDVAIHKENHGSYVREKHILSNQNLMIKEMRKMNNGNVTPPPEEDEAGIPIISSSSSDTVPLEQWNQDVFPWADFSDVTSFPTSSHNHGKAPMNLSDEDYDNEGDDDMDEDTE